MNAQRAPTIPTVAQPAAEWWYTLAYDTVSPAQMAVSATALSEFSASLADLGQGASAALITRVAREVRLAEEVCRVRTVYSDAESGAERYIWAFRRLSDALAVARANRRSDYHPYPQPQSLRDASLDRLYQRFPLMEYPRTRVYLFTGIRVCDDPRIGADPPANALVAQLPGLMRSEDWARYTLCGFRQGVSLVRVNAASRWLRIALRPLEDAWAEALGDAAPAASEEHLRMAEIDARDALMRIAATQATRRLSDNARADSDRDDHAEQRAADVRCSPSLPGKRLTQSVRRPAV